jgi:hypothetical protein
MGFRVGAKFFPEGRRMVGHGPDVRFQDIQIHDKAGSIQLPL